MIEGCDVEHVKPKQRSLPWTWTWSLLLLLFSPPFKVSVLLDDFFSPLSISLAGLAEDEGKSAIQHLSLSRGRSLKDGQKDAVSGRSELE